MKFARIHSVGGISNANWSPAPKIIRTSPTTDNLEQSAKRKSIFSIKPQKTSLDRTKSTGNGAPAQLNPPLPLLQSSTAPPSVRASHISFEEPQERLSTTSVRSGPVRGQDGTHPGLLPAPRLSESSRSEASSADQGVYNGALKTDASSSTSSFFRIPRLKKNRHSLFPFPMKVPPQHIRNDQQSRAVPATSTEQDRELLSTLPSPSRTSLSHPTTASASPDPNLIRKNSTSANSVRSSLSLKMAQRPTRRGRSSTIGSLADIQDDTHHSSPDMAPSSRTSTFTAPRKSFSDLFSRPKHHTDSHAGTESAIPGTPQSMTSKQNSFSIAREIASRPAREPDDTPATYLTRLESAVHKAAVATILAESVDEFYQIALKNYMHGFSFKGDSMDMSIRKFLMEAELPKETQQIDRVLQCFAERYHECNAGVFASTGEWIIIEY